VPTHIYELVRFKDVPVRPSPEISPVAEEPYGIYELVKSPETAVKPDVYDLVRFKPVATIKDEEFQIARPFMKILDFLQRGQYASANVAKAIIEGRGDIASAAWKGLTAEQRGSFIDILKQYNIPGATALGLALDIGLDPTTWLPFGVFVKPFTVGKRIITTTKIGRIITESVPVEILGRLFKPGYRLPEEYYEKKLKARYGLQAKEREVLERIKSLSKGLKKEDRELLTAARQNPDLIKDLNPLQQEKLAAFAKAFEEVGERAIEEGLITREAFDKWKDIYLPGFYPGKTRLVRGEIPPSLFEKVKRPTFTKPKKFTTLDEAERYAREFNRPDLMPEKDIAKLLGIREIEQVRFLARKKFIDDVLEQFGEKVPADIKQIPEDMGLYLPKGALRFYPARTMTERTVKELLEKAAVGELIEITPEIFGRATAITRRVPAYLLPKAIADDLNRAQRFFIGDPATNRLLRFYDTVLAKWKAMATSIRLPFHLRNMYSNWFLQWLGGVSPIALPKRIKQAAAIAAGQSGEIITKAGQRISYKEIRRMVEEMGIRGRGWIGADIPRWIYEELDRLLDTRKVLHPFREIGRAAREFGTAIEDNARIGLFIDRIIKGDTPEAAARRVRKYLFDYQELTPFEQNVMRRIIPFYTWQRKNIPLQIQSILEQPGKYAMVGKAIDAWDKEMAELSEERELLPEYMKDMLYKKSWLKTEKGDPVYFGVDLPYTDINRMFNLHQLISGVTPAKIIAELALNLKTFPRVGMQVERPPGQKVPAPFWVAWLPHEVQKFMGAEPILDRWTGKRVLGIRAKWKYALDTAFPFLSEMSRMNPQPITLEEERAPWRVVSYLTGIKFMPVDMEMQRLFKAIEMQGKLRDVARLMRNYGRPLTKEELQNILERR